MNIQQIIYSAWLIIVGGSVSAANIMECLQPIVGVAVGVATIIATIAMARLNHQRRINLKLEMKIKRKELEQCTN